MDDEMENMMANENDALMEEEQSKKQSGVSVP